MTEPDAPTKEDLASEAYMRGHRMARRQLMRSLRFRLIERAPSLWDMLDDRGRQVLDRELMSLENDIESVEPAS